MDIRFESQFMRGVDDPERFLDNRDLNQQALLEALGEVGKSGVLNPLHSHLPNTNTRHPTLNSIHPSMASLTT
jgi:hypothetical protein